jgi:hypothetical protein
MAKNVWGAPEKGNNAWSPPGQKKTNEKPEELRKAMTINKDWRGRETKTDSRGRRIK